MDGNESGAIFHQANVTPKGRAATRREVTHGFVIDRGGFHDVRSEEQSGATKNELSPKLPRCIVGVRFLFTGNCLLVPLTWKHEQSGAVGRYRIGGRTPIFPETVEEQALFQPWRGSEDYKASREHTGCNGSEQVYVIDDAVFVAKEGAFV